MEYYSTPLVRPSLISDGDPAMEAQCVPECAGSDDLDAHA